mgnify:CR=1 FL=1
MKKKYILPAVKIFIAVVIAIALTKIAFFSGQEGQNQADISSGLEVTTRTTTATVGDITSTVEVKGQVVQDKAVEAKATLSGTVDSLAVVKDAMVTQGEPLLSLKKTESQAPTTGTDADGGPVTTPSADKVTWGTVYAPVSGKVSFNVIENQETTVGMVVATVTPQTYSATGNITASQQYRLTNAPAAATISTTDGPAPFSCTDLKIGTKENTSTTTGQDGSTTTSTGDGTKVEVRCSVPAEQQVFAGLKITIGIDAGSATGAVLAPVTAVEGSVTTGNVWVVTDPDNPKDAEKREVSLGINDGTNIQITDGLAEGETILQYVPGKDIVRTGNPNTCEPDNSACYDENGKEIL